MSSWPEGFIVRPPRSDEAQAVADLIIAGDIARYGEPDWAVEDTRADWVRLGFDLERDPRIVVTPDGRLAAYTDVFKRPNATQLGENTSLHPDFEGLGLDETLFGLAESLAAQHAPLPVQWIMEIGRGQRLVERGYTPVRWLWQMRIEFDGPPAEPVWPTGIWGTHDAGGRRARNTGADRDGVHPAGPRRGLAEEWRRFIVERADYDRSLSFLAVLGEEIVGASICLQFQEPAEGWVRQLAVDEKHRGRAGPGAAAALVRRVLPPRHARAGLGVDANNPSATKLYQGVGMRALQRVRQYQKPAVTGS